MDYDADDTIFAGYIYKKTNPKLIKLTDQKNEKELRTKKLRLRLLIKIVMFLLKDISL